MKLKVAKVTLSLAMLFLLQLPAAGNLIKRVKIDLELEKAPEVEYRKVSSLPVKVDSVNRWLVIRVEYETGKINPTAPQLRKGSRGYELRMHGFIDDLGVNITVLQSTGFQTSGQVLYGKYTGGTAFYSVRQDGKKHLVMMFVPGKLLDRFSRSANGQIRSVSKGDFKVEVVFTVSGKSVAKGYYGCKAREFNEALRSVPVNMVFPGGVFSRWRTPWALFEADEFDLEKELPVGEM